MVRDKPADQRCLHVFGNGKQCCQKIDGQGARYYCSDCRTEAQKKANEKRDRDYSANRRAADREGDNFYHWLYNYKLTEPQMQDYIAHGEALRELYQCLKQDDLYQHVLDQLSKITYLWLDPPTTLPNAHVAAEAPICDLRIMLECLPADCLNSPRDRFLLYIKAFERDQGGWMKSNPFPSIEQQAHELQEAWRIRGDLHQLTHAIWVKAQLLRERFFANSTHMQLWKKAVRWFDAGRHVASLYRGAQKNISVFLDFYALQEATNLAFDIGKPEEATDYIHSIQDRANKVADAWSEGPVAQTALFFAALQQALYYLYRNELVEAEQHSIEAQNLFTSPTMQWRSVTDHQNLAYIKAALALKKGAPDRQEYVHDYIGMLSRNPSLEQYRNLDRLKSLDECKVTEAMMPTGMPIYVETSFNYLRPLLLPYKDVERCRPEVIPQGQESEVMLLAS
jgi:hypothetical protein